MKHITRTLARTLTAMLLTLCSLAVFTACDNNVDDHNNNMSCVFVINVPQTEMNSTPKEENAIKAYIKQVSAVLAEAVGMKAGQENLAVIGNDKQLQDELAIRFLAAEVPEMETQVSSKWSFTVTLECFVNEYPDDGYKVVASRTFAN